MLKTVLVELTPHDLIVTPHHTGPCDANQANGSRQLLTSAGGDAPAVIGGTRVRLTQSIISNLARLSLHCRKMAIIVATVSVTPTGGCNDKWGGRF
ncbi:hypothetical protein AAFF_G00223660 [Aldrovandia affinis]|uniref:Uncharacterized protein n=1 Tax=Aldrovandia affinis TaxID=143900 RepID=A0AAD7X297_9TELE|nr:hypothetical protein AAFF_G00223660 [Aldrovandia affinis]